MNNFYVKLSDNEKLRELQSELLQRTAFENGWGWELGFSKIQFTNMQFIQFWHDKKITASGYEFNKGGFRPITIEQALEYLMNSDKEKPKPELKLQKEFDELKKEALKLRCPPCLCESCAFCVKPHKEDEVTNKFWGYRCLMNIVRRLIENYYTD